MIRYTNIYSNIMWHLLFSSASLAEAAGSFGFKHTNVSWRLQSTLWYLPMVPRAHVLLAAGETNVIFGSEFSRAWSISSTSHFGEFLLFTRRCRHSSITMYNPYTSSMCHKDFFGRNSCMLRLLGSCLGHSTSQNLQRLGVHVVEWKSPKVGEF